MLSQRSVICAVTRALLALSLGGCMPPSWGAGALLHPWKGIATDRSSRPHETVWFSGSGVRLKGWWFKTAEPRRGTVVYLHGVGDNRGSGASLADHFVPRGFDVVAYDGRAHGESEGDACTYGYYEKTDLSRVLDEISGRGPVVLLGTSLGAAIALQAAAQDNRVAVVVAVATFSDLRTVASERAPFFASKSNIDSALAIAEESAKFKVDDVSPVLAAARIGIPVLVIHGAADKETPPAHSVRVHQALHGPKELILVPHAGHNNSLNGNTWTAIDAWIEKWLPAQKAGVVGDVSPADEAHERSAALALDKEARTRRSVGLARSAIQTYAQYVARFGDRPESYEVHGKYAQLLYDLERWKEAGREYQRVVDMLPRGDRSESAAYDRMMTASLSAVDCGAFGVRSASPAPLPACAEEQLAAYDMYLKYFGDRGVAIKIRFQRGSLLQRFHRLREAADAFAEIVLSNESEELAPFAAVHLLQVLAESGRADEARRWAHTLKETPRLIESLDVQTAVAETLGEARPRSHHSPSHGMCRTSYQGIPPSHSFCRMTWTRSVARLPRAAPTSHANQTRDCAS